MTDFSEDVICIPNQVLGLLSSDAKTNGVPLLMSKLLNACQIIGTNLRDDVYSTKKAGSMNTFGDNQLDVDLKTDVVVFNCLKESNLVEVASSEESPTEVSCGGKGFCVAFDPLDGSSIIDANFAVGSIIGVWPGSTLINRTGREQAFSLVSMYGPKITVVLAINGAYTVDNLPKCMELTFASTFWRVSIPKISIKPESKTFAPGNLRAVIDNERYQQLINYWIGNKYTLRYSGGLVPDIYHILVKGHGVMSNVSSPSAKAKLRILYECAPIALIIEVAGGKSCVCASEAAESVEPISILDVPITDLDKRIGVCYGSQTEVERFISHIFQ